MKACLITLLALLLCSPAQLLAETDSIAEDPTAAETPSKAPVVSGTKPVRSPTELFELDAEMAEDNWRRSGSDMNLNAAVRAYDKLLGPLCMPKLHSELDYDGPGENSRCNEYLARVLQIDAELPAAVCARDGIDAESCKEAYRLVEIRRLDSNEAATLESTAEMDLKMHSTKTKSAHEALAKEAQNAAAHFRQNKHEAEARSAFHKAYEKLLPIVCKLSYWRLMAAPKLEQQAARKGSALDLALATPDPVFEMMRRYAGKQYVHARYLAPDCISHIDQARKIDPEFPAPTCYREGFYSPACIAALREFRRKARESLPPQQRKMDGLQSF